MESTFPHILPLGVYYVSADLRSGQPVHAGMKQMYRSAIVQSPGNEPNTLDIYVFESVRSNMPAAAGEKINVPYVEEATLEDWSHGREFCCLRLLPPKAGTLPKLSTQIALPPTQAGRRERLQEAHNEAIERTDDGQGGESEPTQQPTPPAQRPTPANKPAKKAAAKPAASAPKPPAKPAKSTEPDLEPMDFQVPVVGGVTRSRDKQTAKA